MREIEQKDKSVKKLLEKIAERDATIKRLIEYLGPMVDAEDTKCHFDHHGSCQSHGWIGVGGTCPTVAARAYLAKLTTGQ